MHKDAFGDGQIDCLDGEDESPKHTVVNSEIHGHHLTFIQFWKSLNFFAFNKDFVSVYDFIFPFSNVYHNNIFDGFVTLHLPTRS